MKTQKRSPPQPIRNARPSITLSQNFLREESLIANIIRRAGICADDLVIDIGAGAGSVTAQLARVAGHVLAVEIDAALVEGLQQRFKDHSRVDIVKGDFLAMPLPATPFKVFANIPYNITASIIAKLTEAANPPDDIFLILQEEAALRYMGMPLETLAALMLKPWFRLHVLHRFDRRDFDPVPEVDSALLRIQRRPAPLLSLKAQTLYRDFVAHCFINASPSLYTHLERLMGRDALHEVAATLNLPRDMTPTHLDFELWVSLFCQFAQHAPAQARRKVAGSHQQLKAQQSQLQKRHRTNLSVSQQPDRRRVA